MPLRSTLAAAAVAAGLILAPAAAPVARKGAVRIRRAAPEGDDAPM